MRNSRRGFSLLEVIAVVALVALLAGLAAGTFVRRQRHASTRDVVGNIVSLDASARAHAQRFGRPARLRFARGRIECTTTDEDGQWRTRQTYAVPPHMEIALSQPEGAAATQLGAGREVPISAGGASRSYCIELIDTISGKSLGIGVFVCGPTGQAVMIHDASDAENWRTLLGQDRLHAH